MNKTITEDMHVHSTFSDGRDSIPDNLAQAEARGLRRLCCVDHVRRDTDWVPLFAASVAEASRATSVEVECGVEAKILDEHGALDLPQELDGVDRIFAADHRFPVGDLCLAPREVRALVSSGAQTSEQLIASLVRSLENTMRRHPGVVLAHLFSILPKVGMREDQVPAALIRRLAVAARQTGASVEVSERWKCPGWPTIRIFHDEGVPILFSTDSHTKDTIGLYEHGATILRRLVAAPGKAA